MQMDTQAREWLDATVKRILARHALGDAERTGITYELMSHLHAAGEARATAAGRERVTRQDLELALLEAGGEEKLAAAFVQPLAKPIVRVLFARRAGALVIDTFLILLGLVVLHGALEAVLRAMGHTPVGGAGEMTLWAQLMPWGFHDGTLPWYAQLLFAVVSAAFVLGYYVWFEARDGRTPGKRALDLRVMREDGAPMTAREALLRNATKLFPIVFLVDCLIMLVAFSEAKQRASDRLAKTIVVKA